MNVPLFLLSAPTSFATAEANVLPIILAAMLLDVAIVAIWYFIGVLLTNDGVREAAKGEYYQFLGTAFLVVILLWGITAYSGITYGILGSTRLLSASTLGTMCGSIENGSHLDILGASNSLLSGAQTPSGKQLVGICTMLDGDTLTDKMNYPLVATAVVTANLTSQTANNLNGAYTYDAYIGFLSNLHPSISLCFAPPQALQCVIPGFAIMGDYFRMLLSYTPYAGFSILYQSMGTIGTLLNLSFESYIAQLLLISIILYAWPWLLFGGIALRSTFFTRKIGGLLIAVVLGIVIIFPTLFCIEYLTLGNGIPGISQATPYNLTYGFNALSPAPNSIAPIPSFNSIYQFNALSPNSIATGNYVVNFFVMPSMQQIAEANNCWPSVSTAGALALLFSNPLAAGALHLSAGAVAVASDTPSPLIPAEAADIFYLLNPITNVGSGLLQLLKAPSSISSGQSNPYFLPAYCPPTGAVATTMEMLNAYGIMGVTSYFLPIINLVMTLSAIIGMSGLLGGDTTLEGLSRFI